MARSGLALDCNILQHLYLDTTFQNLDSTFQLSIHLCFTGFIWLARFFSKTFLNDPSKSAFRTSIRTNVMKMRRRDKGEPNSVLGWFQE